MSRNQREGRYAGALKGRHYRTRGVNNVVSSLDVGIELAMRGMKNTSRLFSHLFGDIRSCWDSAPATSKENR